MKLISGKSNRDTASGNNGQQFFSRKFCKGLLIYVTSMLILIVIGTAFFYRYIAAFEASQPEVQIAEATPTPTVTPTVPVTIQEIVPQPTATPEPIRQDDIIPNEPSDPEVTYSEEYRELYSKRVEEFIRTYVDYGANVGGDPEENYKNVSEYVLPGSDLQKRIYGSLDSFQWTGEVDVTYNALEIDNFLPDGDMYFTCNVYYNLTCRAATGTYETEEHLEVLFMRSGNTWLAAQMIIL